MKRNKPIRRMAFFAIALSAAAILVASCASQKPAQRPAVSVERLKPKAAPADVLKFTFPTNTVITKAEIVIGDTITVGKEKLSL
ncbi:MAG: hypothetical protein WCT14_22210, partial [Treponemataceae bacterium]